MSLRSPLGKVLGLGSAKDGTGHWWGQRVSAVALVLLGLWLAASLAGLESLRFEHMSAFVAQPVNGVLLALLSITTAYHSWLGVQVVVEDYVHAPAIKIPVLIASRFAHAFVAVLSVYAVLKIGFTA